MDQITKAGATARAGALAAFVAQLTLHIAEDDWQALGHALTGIERTVEELNHYYANSELAGRLFNCCLDNKEPDWSQFDELRLAGMVTDDGGEARFPNPGEEPTMWTVFARSNDGSEDMEPITDQWSPAAVALAASELADLSSLPLHWPVGDGLDWNQISAQAYADRERIEPVSA